MSLGTLLTLFVIPAFYTLIVRKIHLIPEEREALAIAGGAGALTAPHDRHR
jgi:hypothetical protein